MKTHLKQQLPQLFEKKKKAQYHNLHKAIVLYFIVLQGSYIRMHLFLLLCR